MSRVYALANQKGGVGKTTTAINLGAYLAAWGKRALLVDMDPQANSTSGLGIDKYTVFPSIYEGLIAKAPLQEVIVLTRRVRLDLVPSSPSLAGAAVEMMELAPSQGLLKQALASIDNRYDLVLIDTPPSLGLLTVNALVAAEGVIIPVQCEYLALEGLTELMRAIDLVRRELNPQLRILGMLLTMYDSRTNLSAEVVEEMRKHFPQQIFQTLIPRNVRLSEAPSHGESILSYAPKSSGAIAYQAFTQELLLRIDEDSHHLEWR